MKKLPENVKVPFLKRNSDSLSYDFPFVSVKLKLKA